MSRLKKIHFASPLEVDYLQNVKCLKNGNLTVDMI